jgi:hypothetical protein
MSQPVPSNANSNVAPNVSSDSTLPPFKLNEQQKDLVNFILRLVNKQLSFLEKKISEDEFPSLIEEELNKMDMESRVLFLSAFKLIMEMENGNLPKTPENNSIVLQRIMPVLSKIAQSSKSNAQHKDYFDIASYYDRSAIVASIFEGTGYNAEDEDYEFIDVLINVMSDVMKTGNINLMDDLLTKDKVPLRLRNIPLLGFNLIKTCENLNNFVNDDFKRAVNEDVVLGLAQNKMNRKDEKKDTDEKKGAQGQQKE